MQPKEVFRWILDPIRAVESIKGKKQQKTEKQKGREARSEADKERRKIISCNLYNSRFLNKLFSHERT